MHTHFDAEESVAFAPSGARSRGGAITVVTTAAGLPTEIRIDAGQLRRGADALATEITALCREAALAAGVALRSEMMRNGADAASLSAAGLPTHDDLVAAELRADDRR